MLLLARRCIRHPRYVVGNSRCFNLFGYLKFGLFANQSLRAREVEATSKSSMVRETTMKSDAEV